MFTDIIDFLKHPYYKESVFSLSGYALRKFFQSCLFFVIAAAIVALLLALLDYAIVHYTHYHSIKKDLLDSDSFNEKLRQNIVNVIIIFTIAPLCEELAFRLPLIPKKEYWLLGAVIILYFSFGGKYTSLSAFQNGYRLMFFCLSILTVVALFFIIKEEKLISFINSHYFAYFYFVCITFGLIHIFNARDSFQWNIFYLYPLFVIPQMIMGVIMGYLRNTEHFIYGLLFHMLFNFISSIPFLLFFYRNSA